MSITSEIQRIKDNIASAYNECNSKNATMPDIQNSENLPNTIATITTGGGTLQYPIVEGNGKHEVRFVDYDGTLIKVQYVNDGESATAPILPNHERLTFVEWNRDYDNITHDLDVGACYRPTSGNTELFINVTEETGLGITLNIYRTTSSGTITVNWGDGKTSTFGTGTGAKALTHMYSSSGEYMISIITTIAYSLGGNTYDKPVIVGSNEVNIFRALIKCFCSEKVTKFQGYAYNNNVNLEEFTTIKATNYSTDFFINTKQRAIICPRTLTQLSGGVACFCENLEYFIIDDGISLLTTPTIYGGKLTKIIYSDIKTSTTAPGIATRTSIEKIWYKKTPTNTNYSIGSNFANYNTRFKYVPIYDNLTSIGSNAFYANAIEKIKLPPSLTTIAGNAFYGCKALTDIYIYTDSIPTLSATSAFTGINKGCKIHVKPEMLAEFQAATNWSSSTVKAYLVGDLEGEWIDGYCE